jgi:hypothetical protein
LVGLEDALGAELLVDGSGEEFGAGLLLGCDAIGGE